ncbi:MAG: hypothetical protein ACLUOF_07680 [Ruminococcus sp.]
MLETIRIVTVPLSIHAGDHASIWEQIGASEQMWHTAPQTSSAHCRQMTVHKGNIIFPRIDVEKEIDELNRLILAAQPKEEPKEPEFTPRRWQTRSASKNSAKSICVAKVLNEKVKKSKKLLKPSWMTAWAADRWFRASHRGISRKTSSARRSAANLKPAKLCGVESCGMICAADMPNGDVKVIFPDDSLPVGAKIR